MALPIIKVDQSGKPAGTPGQAREDLALGTAVQLTLLGGPFLSQLWTLSDKPNNWSVPVRSAAGIVDPTAAVTMLQPVDVAGTYNLHVAVDSGFGLGATVDDIADLTFYAGPTLNTIWNALPRRVMAFNERLQHNAPDALFPSGNERGWAEEWEKWFGVIQASLSLNSASWGRVTLTGGGAAVANSVNVASATRTGVGLVDIAFAVALPVSTYAVVPAVRGAVGGMITAYNETTAGFSIARSDVGGSLVDSDFVFQVLVA